jgi:hypothetical protein
VDEINWQHRESLRLWSVLASQGHEGAQAVAAYHGLAPPPFVPPSVPRAPRATVPAVPQTPALSGIQTRSAVLQNLLSRPAPTDLV